jgi:hypothetical protein
MLQASIPLSTTPRVGCDSDTSSVDRSEEVIAPDTPLDEAGWSALLIKIDQEEGGP